MAKSRLKLLLKRRQAEEYDGTVRGLALLVLATGCDLVFPLDDGALGGAPADGAGRDANALGEPAEAGCEDTLLCMRFENSMADGSGLHHDVTTSNAAFVARGEELALKVGVDTDTSIARPRAPLDDALPAYTVAMFVEPAASGGSGEVLYRDDDNLILELGRDGAGASCARGGVRISQGATFATDAWRHVACTFDSSLLSLYVDGTLVSCASVSVPVTPGTAIEIASSGSHFVGAIDDLRVFPRALDPRDVCREAGRTACDAPQVICLLDQ